MRQTKLDPDMPVDEIMRRWPAAIRPFIRHRMLCIGCPIGGFHTIIDACDAHGIDPDVFATELHAATRGDASADPEPAGGAAPAERGPPRGGRCGA